MRGGGTFSRSCGGLRVKNQAGRRHFRGRQSRGEAQYHGRGSLPGVRAVLGPESHCAVGQIPPPESPALPGPPSGAVSQPGHPWWVRVLVAPAYPPVLAGQCCPCPGHRAVGVVPVSEGAPVSKGQRTGVTKGGSTQLLLLWAPVSRLLLSRLFAPWVSARPQSCTPKPPSRPGGWLSAGVVDPSEPPVLPLQLPGRVLV